MVCYTMIPNFIWFAVPAPNDILRTESVTEVADLIASICQVLMILSIGIFINKECRRLSITKLIITTIVPILIFTICHLIYGIVNYIIS